MAAEPTGNVQLRAEHIERLVTGFALQKYVMKELVMVSPSSSWMESYYAETATELTGGTSRAVKGVPRLAAFPTSGVTWTKKKSWIVKHGMEDVISWEDATTNNIDVIARTLLRIARAVVKSVDTEIWDTLTENRSVVDINTLAIAAGSEWNSATVANRDPLQNLLDAKRLIAEQNYNPDENGFVVFNPKDYANVLGNANIRNAGQFYTSDVTANGRVGNLVGLKVYVTNSATADYALVGVAKECGTWKEQQPLTVVTIIDPGIKYTIRAWEVGVTQLTNPKALTLISNTAA